MAHNINLPGATILALDSHKKIIARTQKNVALQCIYSIAGNFRRCSSFNIFAGLIFVDAHTHACYVLYNQTYFVGLIFTVR